MALPMVTITTSLILIGHYQAIVGGFVHVQIWSDHMSLVADVALVVIMGKG